MNIQLSDHFTYRKLLRFTLPSIGMMVFTSIYFVVDGYFVSNYTGKTAYAALNFIYPVIMILGAVGTMLGTGGCALVAKTLGEGDSQKAQKLFSMFVTVAIVLGIVFSVIGFLLLPTIANALGATGDMLKYCISYGRIVLLGMVGLLLQYEFQSFFVAAEKPQLGLITTVVAGTTNIVFDWLFVAVFPWGLNGAAIATVMSQMAGGIFPLFYFSSKQNDSLLRLRRFEFDWDSLWKACGNGASEFLSTVSSSLVGILFNIQLMKFAGENGVAAYGTMTYVVLVFIGIFIGYSVGTAPIVSYNYGAENKKELASLFKKSLTLVLGAGGFMVLAGELLSKPLTMIFVSYDAELVEMTLRGFFFYSFSFMFTGFAIYCSSFFTALNNGVVSALISTLRTLLFQVLFVLVLPAFWGLDGIWISIVFAEFCSAALGVFFLINQRKRYGYCESALKFEDLKVLNQDCRLQEIEKGMLNEKGNAKKYNEL